MRLNCTTIMVVAGFVAADEQTRDHLNRIKQATTDFTNSVDGWNGNWLAAIPILHEAYTLNSVLSSAMAPIDPRALCSPEVEKEALDAAQELSHLVGLAVDTGVSKKAQFEAIPLVGKTAAKLVFTKLHSSAQVLAGQFAPRASPQQRETADQIVQEINDHFARGVTAIR